jgi:hypothetical protein
MQHIDVKVLPSRQAPKLRVINHETAMTAYGILPRPLTGPLAILIPIRRGDGDTFDGHAPFRPFVLIFKPRVITLKRRLKSNRYDASACPEDLASLHLGAPHPGGGPYIRSTSSNGLSIIIPCAFGPVNTSP